jgi:hypothetical protein
MRFIHLFAAVAITVLLTAAGGEPLPAPFVEGARWDYNITVAGVNVGSAVRTIVGPNRMKLTLKTDSSARNGDYFYDLIIHGDLLGAVSVTFEPNEGGKPFKISNCNPPLPIFARPGSKPMNVTYPITCKRDGKIVSGTAHMKTLEHQAVVAGIPGCHLVVSTSDVASDILKDGKTCMHPQQGVVGSDIKINWLINSKWRLASYQPAK